MLNIKTIQFELDKTSWNPGSPPKALTTAEQAGTLSIDLDAALIFVAIWTRPPTRPGFTLADCWAWLRYFPAFSSATAIEYCEEWTDIDSRQKTVASEELGVGLTTWALHQILGFQRYADTAWVINVLSPEQWRYRERPRRGPAKSPDFIAADTNGNLSIVECKGTQSSLNTLREAVDKGRLQKENVVPRGGSALSHRLVAGAFIPQWDSSEMATILVVDPDRKALTNELRQYSSEEIRTTTEQVAYAKELAVFDLSQTASALVRESGEERAPAASLDRDIARMREIGTLEGDSITIAQEHTWRFPLTRNGEEYVGVRLFADLNLDRLEPIRRRAAQKDPRESIAEATGTEGWQLSHTENATKLTSPIGAEYRVEWLTRT